MSGELIRIITAHDESTRNRSLDAWCRTASASELLDECASLESFRKRSGNLYEQVRALFFLYAIHRFHLPARLASGPDGQGRIPYLGHAHLLQRRFEESIQVFLGAQAADGPSAGLSSALAEAYHELGFQTLADQVRRSVRSVRGNQWMFRIGHPMDQPLRIRPELREPSGEGLFPILREATPVRMDLSHSAWSDIFFLGMDFPEGARVLNVSIDLAVHGRDPQPRPPVEAYLRVIDEPVLRLVSVDLNTVAEITTVAEVFDYARDYLGLLKAAVIASGLVPPGMEGSGERLDGPNGLLTRLVGPGRGLELVSNVNGIPKGSRLAVSTNLLASLITCCMRATGQAGTLTGQLTEPERRLVAARAILGEWLAGSGGGWQDSGGVWPDMKLITGVAAGPDDPEHGVSRGRLLPQHHIFTRDEITEDTRRKLQDSLILFHGGMAQNVGPILQQVTEKYLLRSEVEWRARQDAIALLREIETLLHAGDVRGIGAATTRNFMGPIQAIIPRATTLFTERLIERAQAAFGPDFWGFWMLGGASGGGMGLIVDPRRREAAKAALPELLGRAKRELEQALPFAMEPVVYDFAINTRGTWGELVTGAAALMPAGYYTLTTPALLRRDPGQLSPGRRLELDRFAAACRVDPALAGMVQTLFDRVMPRAGAAAGAGQDLQAVLDELGFDRAQHEQIRADLRQGRIGLAHNRLPASTEITDVRAGDVAHSDALPDAASLRAEGEAALRAGAVAVVTLAAGVGSRWTEGAGVVKAINPFVKLGGRHRTFLEIHLAKSRRIGQAAGSWLPHLITTSYLTNGAIRDFLDQHGDYRYPGPLRLSPGRAVGLRIVPMARDLRFAWEEQPQQLLDERQQKMRESVHAALINWARATGEGSDYVDNVPLQCLHPVGHWFEIPNLLRNGVLAGLLRERPALKTLMLHNVDAIGADVDPIVLGWHLRSGATLNVEVIARQIEDRGGGLARIDDRVRLVEGLALPGEEDEFQLSYYNSNTFWIDLDRLLAVFGLTRADLDHELRVAEAIRALAARMPTYITLKDVKKRWGYGQEDVFPVAQFEKLWGDMTALPEVETGYIVVPRRRGQNLKDVAQLDGWLRDGSAAYVETLCAWGEA
ncbi:MAG: UTP--glucose-1-phosphate uridylyltransferase [Anaerolineales bacterium]|nr:UTP--glucose-1-phosphate uridylyltransferase [Anaerolineales bacterium]